MTYLYYVQYTNIPSFYFHDMCILYYQPFGILKYLIQSKSEPVTSYKDGDLLDLLFYVIADAFRLSNNAISVISYHSLKGH